MPTGNSAANGLTVDYKDWWFTIRRSNTEPVMRLIVEAKTKDLLEQKVAEISSQCASPFGRVAS